MGFTYENIYYDIFYRDSDLWETSNLDGKVIDKIKSFSSLQLRWDFGQGEPPSNESIQQAIGIYQFGLLLGFNGDARPETDGGVILNLFIDDNFVYLTIKKDGGIDLRYEKGIGVNYEIIQDRENVSFERISKTLQKIKKQCFLSELYTSKNMTPIAEGFQVIASNDTELEYL